MYDNFILCLNNLKFIKHDTLVFIKIHAMRVLVTMQHSSIYIYGDLYLYNFKY